MVSALNRKKMPKYFTCRFDSNLKNHMADNIIGELGKQPLLMRYCGAGFDGTITNAGVHALELSQ